MTRIAGEVTIAAPVEEVFDLVADERNEPRYDPRIAAVRKLGPEPVGVGARFVAEPAGTGRSGEMTLAFDEVDGGTRLAWDWDTRLVGAWRLLTPVLAAVGPSWERRNWVGLKDYVEAHHAG